jgi:hypothetical protein
VFKELNFLCTKEKMGTGVRGRKGFCVTAVWQYSMQKYIALTLRGLSFWTVLEERHVKGHICTPLT